MRVTSLVHSVKTSLQQTAMKASGVEFTPANLTQRYQRLHVECRTLKIVLESEVVSLSGRVASLHTTHLAAGGYALQDCFTCRLANHRISSSMDTIKTIKINGKLYS